MADKDNSRDNAGSRRKMTLMERLGERFDIPADVLSGIYIEMRGRSSLVVKGCRKILLYTTVEVRLLLGNDRLSVCGKGLYCTAYHSGVVEIDGRIDRISFFGENDDTVDDANRETGVYSDRNSVGNTKSTLGGSSNSTASGGKVVLS